MVFIANQCIKTWKKIETWTKANHWKFLLASLLLSFNIGVGGGGNGSLVEEMRKGNVYSTEYIVFNTGKIIMQIFVK